MPKHKYKIGNAFIFDNLFQSERIEVPNNTILLIIELLNDDGYYRCVMSSGDFLNLNEHWLDGGFSVML